jgi:hypothetical protein
MEILSDQARWVQRKISLTSNSGQVAQDDRGAWYRGRGLRRASPSALKPADLSGYPNGHVYIPKSMHVPLYREPVRNSARVVAVAVGDELIVELLDPAALPTATIRSAFLP